MAETDGWIEWHGGECPVPDDTKVRARFCNGEEWEDVAEWLTWGRDEKIVGGEGFRITAYKVIAP